MRNKEYKLRTLKPDKYLSSYRLNGQSHCRLSLLLEELESLGGFNAFTLGSSECSFYTLKSHFKAPAKAISYELSNDEVIFGDLTTVEEEILKLNENTPLKTIILITCIPSIMNLDLNNLVRENKDRLIAMSIPEFKGFNALDALGELYYELYKGIKLNNIADSSFIWDKDNYNNEEIILNLQNKKHIVKNYKYLKMLEALKDIYGYEIINETSFNYDKFINELDKASLAIYHSFINKIKENYNSLILSSSYYYELSVIFKHENIIIDKILLNTITKRAYELLKELDNNLIVEFSNEDNYRGLNLLSTIGYDYCYYNEECNKALISLMRRYLNGDK